MAKGYMIFVEGTNPPQKVHKGIAGAFREMHRLASLNPGKEVMLLQLHKRVMSDSGEAEAESLGSHLPPGENGMVDKSQLVRHQDLPPLPKKSKAA